MNYAIFIVWLISVLSTDLHTPYSLAQTIGHLDNQDIKILQHAFVQSSQRDIDPGKFILLSLCESQFKNRGGDYNATTSQYDSFGWFQFQRHTWDSFSHDYGFYGDYTNPFDQATLAAIAIQHGQIHHWLICGRRSKLNS